MKADYLFDRQAPELGEAGQVGAEITSITDRNFHLPGRRGRLGAESGQPGAHFPLDVLVGGPARIELDQQRAIGRMQVERCGDGRVLQRDQQRVHPMVRLKRYRVAE